MAPGASPPPDRDDDRGGVVQDVEVSRLPALALAGVAWSAIRQWGGRLVSILVFMVLARVLAPESFGLVALAAVFIGFLDVPLRISLGDALVQRRTLRALELDSSFWGLLGVSTLLAAALAAAAPFIASAADSPEAAPLIAALALGLPLTGASVAPEAVLRRQMRFRALTTRKLVSAAIAGGAAVAMALAGAGVWALVIKSLVQSILLTVLALAAVAWRPRLRFSWTALREIATFGFWSVSNSLVSFVYRNIDNLIIGAMLGSDALGYYVVAFQVLTIAVLLVTDTIESTALSAFSRLESDRARIGRGVTVAMRANALVVTAISALTIALSPSITVLMFGEQWLPSVDLVRILIGGSIIAPIASITVTVMKSVGRPDLTFKVAVPKTVALAGVMALTAPLGLYWVSSARIFLLTVLVPVNLYLLNRLCDVDWLRVAATFARVAAIGVAAGAAAVLTAGSWSEPVSVLRFVAAGSAGGLTYLAGVALLARSEVRELLGFVRNRRSRSPGSAPTPKPRPANWEHSPSDSQPSTPPNQPSDSQPTE
jgi:PST family polysaccharide transporter